MMELLWSKRKPICCIHPGHAPLQKYEQIMMSWSNILEQSQNIAIECFDPILSLYGNLALISCYEVVTGNHLIATNGFVKEEEDWKMVFHQAGPTVGRPASDASQKDPSILN